MFSILMLTWNNYETFKRCITSMTPLILDDRVEEVIILDNGSHEISLQKLLQSTEKNYNKIRVIYSSENLGIAKGRKYLYDLAKGEYILSFDSDVVIANPGLFIENFLKAINLPDMWLVGGGGGNHTFFPTLFRNDINNLPSPKNPNEVTLVDEVAGWFHGFKSSRLKKNGGPLYMDERFTPFWGEDSDFCYQIKLLGGKCCILGQGCLGHAWSSCDKKENHKTIEHMWKKMTDKWYPTFGKTFQLDFIEKFYKANYEEYKDVYDIREKYLLEGMRRGHIINPNFIKEFFDVKFNSPSQLVYQDKEYHTRDFIDQFYTRDNLVSNNYRVLVDNLKDCQNAFFVAFNDPQEAKNYLSKELIKVRNSAVIIVIDRRFSYEVEKILSDHFTNYYLAEFTNYFDHTIPFVIAMQETRNHTFQKVIRLSTQQPIDANMNIQKMNDNPYAVEMFVDYLKYSKGEYYTPKGAIFEHQNLVKSVTSYPLMEILEIALRLPTQYSYNISPRYCPRLALDKMVNQLQNHEHKNKSLVVYLTKVEDSEMVKNNTDKLRASGNCDIALLNIGVEKFWGAKELGFDYYFVMQETEDVFDNFFAIFNIIHLFEYSNVILMNDNFEIESEISEFFNHAYYHNISFLKTKNEMEVNLLSFVSEDLMNFAGMVQQIKNACKEEKNKNINVMKTIDMNAQKALGLRWLWTEKREETDDEISIEYQKFNDKFTPVDDFPLNFNF